MNESFRLHCAEIQRVANRILGRCDGAKQADGIGFSRGDLTLGRALAVAPVELWSEKLAGKGAHILWRHRRQVPEEVGLLESLCRIFPNPERVDTPIPAVVSVRNQRLVIASEPIGITEAQRKEFSKLVRALGFDLKPDGHWILERDYDLSKLDDPVARLARLGWHVLPEATGYLDSYLERIRLDVESRRREARELAARQAEAAARDARRVSTTENSPEFIERIRAQFNPGLHLAKAMQTESAPAEKSAARVRLTKEMTDSGRIRELLQFRIPSAHPHAASVFDAFPGRIRNADSTNAGVWFVIESPTAAEIRLAKRCAVDWGLSGHDKLPEG